MTSLLADHSQPEFAAPWKLAIRLSLSLVCIAFGLAMCLLLYPCLKSSGRSRASCTWARWFVWCLGVRVHIVGNWPTSPGRFMLVSNHISWLDIFVLLSVLPIRFVSKAEVKNWPVAGYLARSSGTLFINRTSKRDTVHIGAEMLAVMEAGEVIGVFPEGTTSDGSVLLPFFSPLIQPAVNSAAQIVPTGILYQDSEGRRDPVIPFIGDQSFVDSLLITLRRRALNVKVCFGSSIETDQSHRREITRQAESAVAHLLGVKVDESWRAPGQALSAMPRS